MLKKSSLQHFNFSSILSKACLAFSFILLVSCAGKSSNQPTEIRIVDLNGNPKPVKRMVPEGNAQMLASQSTNIMSSSPEPTANPATNPVLQNYQKPTPESISGSDLAAPAPSANVAENKPVENKPFEATVSYDMSDAKTDNKPAEPTNLAEVQTTESSNKKFKLAIATVKTNNAKTNSQKSTAAVSGKGGILIQIGSFSSADNANKVLAQSKQIAAGTIEEVDLGGKKNYRVFLGPASNLKKAHVILKKAKNSGYKDAFIVK